MRKKTSLEAITHHEHYMDRKEAILALLEQYSPGRAAVEDAISTINALEQEEIENTVVAPQAQNDNDNVPHYNIGKIWECQYRQLQPLKT